MKKLFYGLGIVVLALYVILNLNFEAAQGSAPQGYKADVASTSALVIGTTADFITATSTCVSRIVTTDGNTGVMFTFGDETGQTPNLAGTLGHFQAASTTIVYDSGTYGCGRWKAISDPASAITITEFTSFR